MRGNRIDAKPMSVNACWQGKRFKTVAYKRYEALVMALLPPLSVPNGLLSLTLCFGVSTVLCDVDNPVKPFVDILQKKYGFNDRYIMRLVVDKQIVKKGQEFIHFEIEQILEEIL